MIGYFMSASNFLISSTSEIRITDIVSTGSRPVIDHGLVPEVELEEGGLGSGVHGQLGQLAG